MSALENTVVENLVPSEFYLSQNYPNPFREKTIIKFCVPYKTHVKLEIFSSEGELIKDFLDEEKDAGTYEIEISVKGIGNSSANHLCKGFYLYKLKAGDYVCEKKMILSKQF
jgi:MoaA/NifB/PqqE/SkfB family radical SAM enzyme